MSGFYNLRTTPKGWQVTKFDEDFNVESSYEMTQDSELRCGCPAGARPKCRHRDMFPFLLPKVDTAWFLDHNTYQWVDPTGEAQGAETKPLPTIIGSKPLDPATFEGFEPKPEPIVHQPDTHPFRRRL